MSHAFEGAPRDRRRPDDSPLWRRERPAADRQSDRDDPAIRAYSDQIERDRRLPPELVAQMRDAGFFHALLPRDLGGLEADPVTAARIVEEVSKGDASAGWCVMLAAQSCMFAGFMPAEESRTIWGNGGIVAGTARPIGRAVGGWTAASTCRRLALRQRQHPRHLVRR